MEQKLSRDAVLSVVKAEYDRYREKAAEFASIDEPENANLFYHKAAALYVTFHILADLEAK